MSVSPQNGAGVVLQSPISLPVLRPLSRSTTSTTAAEAPPTRAASTPPAVQSLPKLELELLGSGDKVVVRTANTTYSLEVLEGTKCRLTPGNPKARSGEGDIAGGTNAEATEYTPNRLFVGGRMAFLFNGDQEAMLTSVVESIFRVPAKSARP